MKRGKKEKSDFPERIDIFEIDTFESDKVDITERFKNILNSPNVKSPFIILILESPHKNEFKGKIGPAKGNTGINIREHIWENFRSRLVKFQNYHLILMNAIPFQCSFGVKTDSFRDAVFATAWENDEIGKSFFGNRLGALLGALGGKTVVIVNACTAGKSRKSNVTDAILKQLDQGINEVWEVPHPSSRQWCDGESINKIYPTES